MFNSILLFMSKILDIYDDFKNAFGYDPRENFGNHSSSSSASDAASSGSLIAAIVGICVGVVMLAVVITIIVVIVKNSKNVANTAHDYYTKIKEKFSDVIKEEKNKNICEYCGSKLKEDEDRCSSCGARKKR